MTRRKSRYFQSVFLLLAATLPAAAFTQTLPPVFPGDAWEVKTPAELGMDPAKLTEAQNYALTKNGSGLIVRSGYQVAAWGIMTDRYPVFSLTKAIGAVLLGVANNKPELAVQLTDRAQVLYPDFGTVPVENTAGGFLDDVTIEQLATHSAGFKKDRLAPELKYQPGTQWVYSDGGANWLADILTAKFGEDLALALEREVLAPLSLTLRLPNTGGDLEWRDVTVPADSARKATIGAIPRREFNAGISANVDALARIGLLLERDGNWNGTQILSPAFIDRLSTPAAGISGLPITDDGGRPDPRFPNATQHHGLFWWNNADGTLPNVPRDAFWGWGFGDHVIVVIPSLQLVVARTSSQAPSGDGRLQPATWSTDANCQSSMCTDYAVLDGFLTPIVQSVQGAPNPNPNPNPNPQPNPTPDEGGGGGGALEWWLLGALLISGGASRATRVRRRGPLLNG
jgi:CubicO group peptidase (beta-lactamase class C family)